MTPQPPRSTGTVAVVGNGPVGQTTALLLARWGVPVVLLDRRPRRDLVGSKAICQQRDVLAIWAAVGAGRRIADEGLTWTTARNFHRDRELFSYPLGVGAGDQEFPPFVNISQCRTEEILDERIAESPLIEVRWDHEVTAVDQDDEVRLTCRTASGEVRVRADWAVLCSGAHSDRLRKPLGVRFDGPVFGDRFLICDVRVDLPEWERERRFYFDPEWNPGRQVLIHPCPDSTFRIDWQIPDDYQLAAEEASGALDRRVRAIIGERDHEIVWSSVYRFQSCCADRFRVGRVLLAGDCAHLYSPFGARGLNSGVQDAENAAWKLAFVLHGWAEESLLESYHWERHAAARENLAVTTATMRFLVPQDEQQRAEREAVLRRASECSDAWPAVDSGRLAEPFWYADSALTTPSSERPSTGRPPRGEQAALAPGVLPPDVSVTVDGRVTGLRALCWDGFVLLAVGAEARDVARSAARWVRAPVRVFDLDEIDVTGRLSQTWRTASGEVWVLRPDGHIAAIVARATPEVLASSLLRACGDAGESPVAEVG